MTDHLLFWLGADGERVWQEHLIEQAKRDAEAMRRLQEECPE